ncbi:NosD domain-containing protein [Microbulbifer sp. JMSA003]|uniref:NosD domain-containing protein n=1 Tax=Microbulbifer sp. JMSA003 TaxID=3243369 RepID=UPI004039B51A
MITNYGTDMVVSEESHNIVGVNVADNMILSVVIPGNNSNLFQSVIMNNANVGVVVTGSINAISSNKLGLNEFEGILLEVISNSSVILLNLIYSSLNSGKVIEFSNKLIAYNFVEDNVPGSVGIYMSALGQSGNRIIGNQAADNVAFDLQDLNSAPCLNIWTGKVLDTSGGVCVDP